MAASASSRPRKWVGTRIGMLETANALPGNAIAAGASRFSMNSRKRMRAARSGMPNSSQRRIWSAERRQPAGLHRHEQHEARPLRRRLPQRGVALQGRVGRLQILVRHHAEHMVGGVVALLHPGVDVVAALDLPFVDVRRMPERLELLGDPERPVAVARRIADEDIRHPPPSRRFARSWRASSLSPGRRASRLQADRCRERRLGRALRETQHFVPRREMLEFAKARPNLQSTNIYIDCTKTNREIRNHPRS